MNALAEDVIASILGHHARRAERAGDSPADIRQPLQYRAESLDVLFRRDQL